MKNRFLLLFISPLFIFASCQKQDKLTYTERHLIGNWSYEKVKYNEAWSLNTIDLTEDYNNTILTFYNDYTLTSVDQLTGDSFSGIWEVNIVYTQEYNQEQLIASLTNDLTGELMQIIWDEFSVTKKKIWSDKYNNDGHYNYKLVRQ